jgi:NCS1 family nucleobase:cation symporter-1
MIGAVTATLIGIVGYHFIHKFNKIGTWVMGGALMLGFGLMIPHINVELLARGSFNLKGWFAMFCVCAIWQISFRHILRLFALFTERNWHFQTVFNHVFRCGIWDSFCILIWHACCQLCKSMMPCKR